MGRRFDMLDDGTVLEDRNFKQQMADLDVPIETTGAKREAKPLTPWLSPKRGHKLGSRQISYTDSYIGFGEDIYKTLEAEFPGPLRVALRVVEYEGKKAVAIKTDNNGYKVTTNIRGNNMRLPLSSTLRQALKDSGLKYGRYTVNRISGGFLAVLDE
jgi:hypothetical protein